MDQTLKITKLFVLVVVWVARHTVDIVEYLYSDRCVDIKEEDEERHEAKDDRHNFQDDLKQTL